MAVPELEWCLVAVLLTDTLLLSSFAIWGSALMLSFVI
jgi:hypothetical protein